MKAFKARFALIDCGRVSRRTRGALGGFFSEGAPYPYIYWG